LFTLGQSADQNYILTSTVRDSTGSKPPSKQITYFDGLGRPMEQINFEQSASGKTSLPLSLMMHSDDRKRISTDSIGPNSGLSQYKCG